MTEDGGHQHRVSADLTCTSAPQWSADAAWIFFTNPCASAGELLRIRPNGSQLQVISSVPSFIDNTRWSPDRQQVVITRSPSDIYIVEADGSGERFIATGYYFPQWSPDGDWIYVRPISSDRSSLDRIHVTTGAVESLLPPQTIFGNPRWSPDGTQIVLAMSTEGGDKLFLMNPDGSNLSMIPLDLPEPRIDETRWSPDGRWIAFVRADPPGFGRIYRVRPDGSDQQHLAGHIVDLTHLEWSPDSAWLFYVAEDLDASRGIFRLRADGSQSEILTPGPGDDYAPQYAPVSGLDWHPLPLLIAALGILALSMIRRFRP
jgi:TolB protein